MGAQRKQTNLFKDEVLLLHLSHVFIGLFRYYYFNNYIRMQLIFFKMHNTCNVIVSHTLWKGVLLL